MTCGLSDVIHKYRSRSGVSVGSGTYLVLSRRQRGGRKHGSCFALCDICEFAHTLNDGLHRGRWRQPHVLASRYLPSHLGMSQVFFLIWGAWYRADAVGAVIEDPLNWDSSC
jgi:hypothetical protein